MNSVMTMSKEFYDKMAQMRADENGREHHRVTERGRNASRTEVRRDDSPAVFDDEWDDYLPTDLAERDRSPRRGASRRDHTSRARGRGAHDQRDDARQQQDRREESGRDRRDRGRHNRRPQQDSSESQSDAEESKGSTAGSAKASREETTAIVSKPDASNSANVPDWVRDLVDPLAAAMPMNAVMPKVVVIPDRFVSKVVGYQGDTLKEIQMSTGTYIQMDNSRCRTEGVAIATITGQMQANIDNAEMMIQYRIQNGIQTQQAYVNGKHGMGKGGYLQMGLGLL